MAMIHIKKCRAKAIPEKRNDTSEPRDMNNDLDFPFILGKPRTKADLKKIHFQL